MSAKRTPITAIITRTKNRPLLLERAVKSVLAQTSKDYIHVILNDGGDKIEVEDILSQYPDLHRKVIHNESSVGLTTALNQGIRAVNSDFIAILDDDDSWLPDRVEKVTKYLEEKPEIKGVAVMMDRVIEEVKGDKINEISRNPWYEGITEVSLFDQLLDNYLTNNCITYRRELYEELGGYDETLEVAEDWDFGIRYLLRYDISFIPEVLALYHHRPEATGDEGNSVFAAMDLHKKKLITLRNRYLRKDIERGLFGVGYIMNNLDHERNLAKAAKVELDEQTVRLEGHVNYATNQMVERIKSFSLLDIIRKKKQ